MPPVRYALGLDVGGANLKAAHSCGRAAAVPFALWKQPGELADALRHLIQTGFRDARPPDVLALTMTGELCDCFEGKRQGVRAILDAVESSAGGANIRVWQNNGRFVGLAGARANPLLAAAANWLALATFAGRYQPGGPALLVDVGSTTTDIIPLLDGRPVPRGRTDPERLRRGELVYVGVRRTPLCALLGGGVAAEVFATILDAHQVLGHVEESPGRGDTADGRPCTREAAHARLARMLCADLETSTEGERLELAELAHARQREWIAAAVNQVVTRLPGPPRTMILAGEGSFLFKDPLRAPATFPGCRTIDLGRELGPGVSGAACAYAVAVLAVERGGDGA